MFLISVPHPLNLEKKSFTYSLLKGPLTTFSQITSCREYNIYLACEHGYVMTFQVQKGGLSSLRN